MILDRLKRTAMTIAMSPQTMKMLSNPNVQKAMMRAINIRADIRDSMQKNVASWARNLNLVTTEEVRGLRRTIRDLETALERMTREQEPAQPKEPKPTSTTAPAAAPEPAKKKIIAKKKIVAKKKVVAKKKIITKKKTSNQ